MSKLFETYKFGTNKRACSVPIQTTSLYKTETGHYSTVIENETRGRNAKRFS